MIGFTAEVSSQARQRISEKTGIPVANIVVIGTHTHTGPLYFGSLRKYFHDAAMAKYGQDPCEPVDYSAQLIERLMDVVSRAHVAAKPVELSVGVTDPRCPSMPFSYEGWHGAFQPSGQQNRIFGGPGRSIRG